TQPFGNTSTFVEVISGATNTIIAMIPLIEPSGVAVTPDGSRLYVTGAGADHTGVVWVVATATNDVIATIPLTEAGGVAVTPDGSKLYATRPRGGGLQGNVSVIETATNEVIATIPVGALPGSVAVTPDGSKVYVSNLFSSTVSVISTATNTVT